MIWAMTRLRRDFKTWDRPTQIAVILGLALLALLLIVAFAVPELRQSALIGAGGLLLISEAAALWGNRGMISLLSQAQRRYLDGDLTGTVTLLEEARVRGKVDARALTLLGNTYRQLGRLTESESLLSEAIDKAPNHYFPHYGFGRTLLAKGDYAGAVEAMRRAVALGAPSVVRLDVGEACYRAGLFDEALVELDSTTPDETYRQLMRAFLLHKIAARFPPPSPELIREGLPYWVATAERFRHTAYGAALHNDIEELQGASH
jgi:tetratricopeptide (TPR) repeat protein